jgi:peptidoglycan/xylan/chitin deacetylase (PgdA/CDA1 family)
MVRLRGAQTTRWAGWFRWWVPAALVAAAACLLLSSWAAVAVLAGLLAAFGFGVALPGWNFFGPVVVDCGDPQAIALTFDDGPDPEMTPLVLDWLSRNGFQATFFLVGRNVLRHPDLARRILAEGHLVASHSFDHSPFSNFRLRAAAERDLERERAAFREVLGTDPALHRPPVGLTNPHLFRALSRQAMTCVCWNRAGRDAGNRREAGIRAIGGLARPGAIVLLHDVLPRPEHRALVLAELDRLAEGIRVSGLRTIRLDQVPGLVAAHPCAALEA